MSTDQEWGGIVPHRLPLDEESEDAAGHASDPIEIHNDQEDLEYESYADTAMTIPGQGEPGSDCGCWKPFEFCDECADLQWGKSRCERRSCPDCAKPIWERQRTEGGVQRLAKARYNEDDGIDRRAIHAVVSAPADEKWESERVVTINQWYDGYKRAYELAKEQGIRGGVCIGHGYRVKDEIKREYRALDLDYGIWKYIREDKPVSWRDCTYWSPHWHIIGLCRDLAENKPEQQNGWNCVRIDSLDSFTSTTDRKGCDDMVGRVRYLLDHGTFESDTSKDCVRWFGELATTKFQPEEELSTGANDAIDRLVEEVLGDPVDEDDDGDGSGRVSEEEWECDNCGSTSFSSIFDAGAALLDERWCEEIGRDQERRLQTAFEWMIGDVLPPPGLKNPTTEAEAKETFDELLPSGVCHKSGEGGEEVNNINPDSKGEYGENSPATQVGASDCKQERTGLD